MRVLFPLCFVDLKQYTQWRAMAVRANETATICMDCSPLYKSRMKALNRCQPDEVRAVFAVRPFADKHQKGKQDEPATA